MAIPWIRTVADEIAAAFPFLQSAVRQNIGADSMYRYLTDAGYDVVRSDVRDAMSDLRAQFFATEYIRTLPRDYKPDPSLLPPSSTHQLLNYRYTFSVEVLDPDTGETVTLTKSLLSSSLLDKTTAEAEMLAALLKYPKAEQLDIISVNTVEITRRA